MHSIERTFCTADATVHGTIRLGSLRSGQLYTDEDLDLLNSLLLAAEQQLERLALNHSVEEQRIEAERKAELFAMKSFFINGVTHDLKTPLTSIRMFANLLQQRTTNETELKYLDIIDGESERLLRMIDQALAYAKIEGGGMVYRQRPYDLVLLVKTAVQMLRYQLTIHEFTVSEQYCMQAVSNVDADALTNCVLNLLSNAMKYSTTDRRIEVTVTQTSNEASIVVADHGIGIKGTDRIDLPAIHPRSRYVRDCLRWYRIGTSARSACRSGQRWASPRIKQRWCRIALYDDVSSFVKRYLAVCTVRK